MAQIFGKFRKFTSIKSVKCENQLNMIQHDQGVKNYKKLKSVPLGEFLKILGHENMLLYIIIIIIIIITINNMVVSYK